MDSANYRSRLLDTISSILRPLTRLCISKEVTHSDLVELSRMAFVESAQEHFRLPESEMTNARIAVLTGMSRKHVKHVKDLLSNDEGFASHHQNRAQRVVQGWLNDAEFLDKNKKPLILPIKKTVRGKERGSFVALVKRYSGDVSYGAILDELNHSKMTEQLEEDSVSLIDRAYIPKDDSEQIRVIGKSVSDLFETTLHNIEVQDGKKRLQRQVVYSHIDEALVEELQTMIESNAKELIDKLNARLKQAKTESSQYGSKGLKRVGFGVYYIESENKKSNPDEK